MNKSKYALLIGIAGIFPIIGSLPAHAVDPFGVFTYAEISTPGFQATAGDKTYYDFKFVPNGSTNYWNNNPDIRYTINNSVPSLHNFLVTSLNPKVGSSGAPITLTYSYKVKINNKGNQFYSFQTSPNLLTFPVNSGITPSYSGSLTASDASTSTLIGTSSYINATPGNVHMFMPTYPNPLQFNGSITLTKNVILTQITDTITQSSPEVPGPLPMAGAAAAFGYSRKLRKRLKATA